MFRAAVRPASLLSVGAVAVLLATTAATAAPAAITVTGTEVVVKAKNKRVAQVSEALRAASAAEAGYYDPAQRPATLRVTIDKLGFRSAGKALAGNLPLVGMFTGASRNVMKGKVALVDAVTGKEIRQFKIECDDDTNFSGTDAALAYGKIGLSFLPFGSLIAGAVDVAEGAANKRDRAEQMLTRGFVMLSYRKLYGDKLYKSFSPRRKAALAAASAARKGVPATSDAVPASAQPAALPASPQPAALPASAQPAVGPAPVAG